MRNIGHLDKQLENDEFVRVWNASEARYQVISAIIKLRKEHNITQGELAQRVGVTQNVISKIERGKINIGLDFLGRVAVIKLKSNPLQRLREFF